MAAKSKSSPIKTNSSVLKKVALRNHKVAVQKVVLVEGEMTGHAHCAVGMNVEFADGQLTVPETAEIVHEEHKTIVLPAGKFMVGRVREQDHFAEEARSVRD